MKIFIRDTIRDLYVSTYSVIGTDTPRVSYLSFCLCSFLSMARQTVHGLLSIKILYLLSRGLRPRLTQDKFTYVPNKLFIPACLLGVSFIGEVLLRTVGVVGKVVN